MSAARSAPQRARLVPLAALLALAAADDLSVMRSRIVAQAVVQPQFIAAYDAEVAACVELLAANFSFRDIDYTFQEAAIWPAYNHSKRVEWMASALITPGSRFFNDSALRATALSALDYWLLYGPQSKQNNWWWWTIGIPITLGKTVTILDGLLLPNQTAAASAQLANAKTAGMTAANLVWTCEGTIYRGLLLDNETYVAETLQLAFATIAYAPGLLEGIKSDASFFEHGNQLYSGGYGESYAFGVAMLLSWTDGLPIGLPAADPRHAIFSHFVLDGSQRMITYGAPPAGSGWGVPLWDVSVIGRDISRPYNSNWGMQSGLQVVGSGVVPQGYGLEPAIMIGVGGPRAAEFVAFAHLLNGTASAAEGAAALLGNRVFAVADYVRHASASGGFAAGPAPGVGWAASVRMASVRTSRCESGNGENLQGQHLSDGAIFLYVTGYDYVDSFPAWDWQRVPGTSALPFSTPSMAPGGQGTTRFVGGASDGAAGSAVLDVATTGDGEGLRMRRSVFFFDDVYVVLGANASAPPQHAALPLFSTIAQRRLSATGVFTSDSGGAPIGGEYNFTLPRTTQWVWEGGVGVFFPQGAGARAPLRVSNVLVRNASWSRIGAMTDNVTVALFTLTLEQPAPIAGAAFAYAVAPNIALADFEALVATLARPAPAGLSVVRNDGGAQAVLHGPAGLMQAAVFELDSAGGVAGLDGGAAGWRASVDAPGAYLLRVDAARAQLSVTAASPAQVGAGAWAARLVVDRALVPGAGGANATCAAAGAVALLSPPGDGTSQTATCALASL